MVTNIITDPPQAAGGVGGGGGGKKKTAKEKPTKLRVDLGSGGLGRREPGWAPSRPYVPGAWSAVLCCAVLCCAVLCCAVLCASSPRSIDRSPILTDRPNPIHLHVCMCVCETGALEAELAQEIERLRTVQEAGRDLLMDEDDWGEEEEEEGEEEEEEEEEVSFVSA